ncbi:uncharacterized protein V2V93DRAFT_363155 [Kockiozyma suomiensis]|uniref:uncharacterized protein n=1 Tax=Kockiozyma suomiensis TaxID=1337062 RepID=UPI003343F0D4
MLQTRQTRGCHDHHHARSGRRPSNDSSLLLLPTSYFLMENIPSDAQVDATTRRAKLYLSSQQNTKAVAILSRKSSTRAVTHIPELPPSFFEYFDHITSLRLGCGLQRLPPHISRFKLLKSLDLRGNRLKSLPYQIKSLNLQQLIVDDVVTPDFSELTLTDFVRHVPASDELESDTERAEKKIKRVPRNPSIDWLGGPPTLKETVLHVILGSVALSELDMPTESSSLLSYVPNHLIPRTLPPNECAFCCRTVLELTDPNEFHSNEDDTLQNRKKPRSVPRRYRTEVVALRKVILEYLFCSRRCLVAMEAHWREEDVDEQIKVIQRGMRFMGVAHLAMA